MPQKKFDIDVSKIESSEVCKPGDLILAELERKNISQKELADAIGKSTPVVNDLIKGKRKITVPIACLLGAVFDSAPEEWLNIQNLYDIQESNADEDLRKRTQRIKNWNAFKDAINVRQLKKRLSLKCDLDGCIESTLLDTAPILLMNYIILQSRKLLILRNLISSKQALQIFSHGLLLFAIKVMSSNWSTSSIATQSKS